MRRDMSTEELAKLSTKITQIEFDYTEEVDICFYDYDNRLIDLEVNFPDGDKETLKLDRLTFQEV
jgi:hypothetical protein